MINKDIGELYFVEYMGIIISWSTKKDIWEMFRKKRSKV